VSIAIRRDDWIMVREIDSEFLVLDTLSNQIHQLNRTASFIWRMCDEGAMRETIASALASEFAVDEETALNDVVETLSKLRALNLLADG
jgi:Coenzyme PQQ synthesis protein D (PqqD)